jgi:hypothetical protein
VVKEACVAAKDHQVEETILVVVGVAAMKMGVQQIVTLEIAVRLYLDI